MENPNSKNFAIGMLSVTAVVLFVGLVIVQHVSPPPAYASGQGGITGDYVVSTARLDSTTEVLFVADTVAQEMNMYAFIPAAGAIELVQKFDLRALDRINQPPKDAQERGNRRERGR
jgi:hypothetical protein